MKSMAAILILSLHAAKINADGGRLDYECYLHDESEVRPALKRFRGESYDGEVRTSIQNYLAAKKEGVISNAHAYYCIAWIQSAIGLYDEAIVSLDKAIEDEGNEVPTLFLRAMIFTDLNRCDEAELDFQTVEDAGATDFGFYLNWARSALSCNNPGPAIGHLEKASRYFSDVKSYPTLVLLFSETYLELEEFNLSFEYADEALERLAPLNLCRHEDDFCSSPELIEAVDLATRSLCGASRIEEAAAVFEQYEMYQFPEPSQPNCLNSERKPCAAIGRGSR